MKRSLCLASGSLGLIATVALLMLVSASHGAAGQLASLQDDDGTWITYTTADGLPSNSVWGGVAVDDVGNVWAGFENGSWAYPLPTNTLMARLEGTSWMTYQLRGCRVWPLVAEKYVYAGTYCPGPPSNAGGGLYWFTGNTWVNFTPEDGMTGTYVSAIAAEGDTRVWVASGDDLYWQPYVNLLDHKGTATKLDDEWTVYNWLPNGISSVYSIAVDPKGNRWFGTNAGILKMPADGGKWISYTDESLRFVGDSAFDAMGNAWFARGMRVIRFDGHSWTYYNSREEAIEANFAAIMTSINRNRVNPVHLPGLWAVEKDAGVWIIRWNLSGYAAGVGFYDGKSWATYTTQNSGLGSDSYIDGIAVDHQGSVWIGTEYDLYEGNGGVNKFTPAPNFSLSVSSGTFLIEPGWTVSVGILISHLRGWVPAATLSITGLPPATSAALSSNPLTPTSYSSLSITTTYATPLGTYPLTITATGAEVTRTAMITLLVVPQVYRYYWPILVQNSVLGTLAVNMPNTSGN